MLGVVWPDNHTAFPDWFNPSATDWWINQCSNFHQNVSFDGLWIDMNEPSSFGTNKFDVWYCSGSSDGNSPKPCIEPLVCPNNTFESPPYLTHAIYQYPGSSKLSDKTICMSAVQNQSQYRHYDVHNLYGLSEAKPTWLANQCGNWKTADCYQPVHIPR